jgi:hypothetical protein
LTHSCNREHQSPRLNPRPERKIKAMITSDHASTVVADCAHARTRVELLSQGPHHSRVICQDCRKQLCFRANPSNAARRRQNAANIQRLLGSNRLSDFERGFCEGLHHNQRPTTSQQAFLDQLVKKILRKDIQIEHTKRNGEARYSFAV